MKSVVCNTLVWVREVPHEAGTKFSIVSEPKADKEIDQTLADAWVRNGWVEEGPLTPALSPKGRGGAAGEGG